MCCNKSKMEGYLFLVLLYLIGVTMSRSQEEPTTYMVQNHTTWTSAVQSCNKKGGSLLTDVEIEDYILNKMSFKNLQFEDDWQKLGSQEFWIKEYNYKSPWISAKGCFSGSPSDTSTKITSQSNTVGTCYQRCSQFDYFATQGNSCTCLTKTEIEAFTEENGALCNVTCPGEVRERCGGSGVHDVYQTMDIHPYQGPHCQQSQDCDCVGLRCNSSTRIYFNDVCQNAHKFVCPFGESLFIGTPVTWSNSFDFCVSVIGRYPVAALNKDRLSSLCRNIVWLGIFRLTLASKGIITCPYCTLAGMNNGDLTCNVTDCHSNRTSICKYREDNALKSNMFTTTVTYGILIGVLIGMLSCVAICGPIVIFLKRKLSRQRDSGGAGEFTQVYFTASGGPCAIHVYEGLDVHDYVEPI